MGKPGQFVRLNNKNKSENLSKVSKKSKPKNKQKSNPKKVSQIKETVKHVKKQKQKQKPLTKKGEKLRNAVEKPRPAKSSGKKKKSSASNIDFHEDLADRLKSSRFRFINEQLYTHESEEATEIMAQDPDAFTTYHEGYRKQVEQWPLNPLDRIIKSIKALPLQYIVADFGCGEGRLGKTIERKCHSLDLVAADDSIIACDMAHTPLQSNSVNVAVFCLSLMGTNLKDFILEANRVLKIGGHLKIAEIETRFDDVNRFVHNLQFCGFQLISKDISTKVFYFLYFKKVRDVTDSKQLKDFSLNPCLYKKR